MAHIQITRKLSAIKTNMKKILNDALLYRGKKVKVYKLK